MIEATAVEVDREGNMVSVTGGTAFQSADVKQFPMPR
jgi:hypothetical protein